MIPAVLTPPLPPLITITPWSMESLAAMLASNSLSGSVYGGGAAATWPAAGRALYIPFTLGPSITVVKMFMRTGAVVGNGTVDLGIYTEDFTAIVTNGPVATAGATSLQVLDPADAVIGPGVFHMAICLSSAVDTVFRAIPAALLMQTFGCAQQDLSGSAGGGTLPVTSATPAAIASAYLPFFGLTTRTLV